MFFMLVTFETSHVDMFPLKAEALSNMPCMLVTWETFHDDRSAFNRYAELNM